MQRGEFEYCSKEVRELILKIAKAPRKRNAALFLGATEPKMKPLLLPAPKNAEESFC